MLKFMNDRHVQRCPSPVKKLTPKRQIRLQRCQSVHRPICRLTSMAFHFVADKLCDYVGKYRELLWFKGVVSLLAPHGDHVHRIRCRLCLSLLFPRNYNHIKSTSCLKSEFCCIITLAPDSSDLYKTSEVLV